MVMATTGYFDASGKERDVVLSVAGSVAPVKTWGKFERDWNRILKKEGVTEFHATDFAASRGEYEGWKGDRPRRSQFLHDLGVVLRNSVNRLFMVSIEMGAWKNVNEKFLLQESFYSPYALAGFTVVSSVVDWRAKNSIEAPIEYIFEDGDEDWSGLKALCESSGITPIRLPKVKAVPCQAADMVAWKNRIACTEALKHLVSDDMTLNEMFSGIRDLVKDLESLNKVLVCPGDPLVYGADALIRNCKNWNVPKRSITTSG